MGKRKSKSKHQERIRKKICRLERRLAQSDTDSSDSNFDYKSDRIQSVISIPPEPVVNFQESDAEEPNVVQPNESNEVLPETSALSAIILEPKVKGEVFAPKIREKIAERWGKIVIDGLNKESIQTFMESILVPENLKTLKAPVLNQEIASVLSDSTKKRDSRLVETQNHLGKGIAAITTLLSTLIDSEMEKSDIIKELSKIGELLLDLHCQNTLDRRNLIACSLNKKYLNKVQGVKRDSFLFGENLGDKIKANETAVTSGLQIERTFEPQPSTSSYRPNVPHTAPVKLQRPALSSSRTRQTGRAQIPCLTSPIQATSSSSRPVAQSPAKGDQPQAEPAAVEDTTSTVAEPYPGIVTLIKKAFLQQLLSQEAIKILTASLSQRTLEQYDAAYRKLWTFCQVNHIEDCLSISNSVALDFLTDHFNSGSNYFTINIMRSALSLLLGNRFSSDINVSRLLKGLFETRPYIPKYHHTWDTNVVLDFISKWYPNEDLPLSTITKKLVVLLALSTTLRVQTISGIMLSKTKITSTGIEIVIDNLTKTSTVERPKTHLKIPFFSNSKQICPAHTLISYVKKTEFLRQSTNTERLILTTQKPYHNATSATISYWIKQALCESGVDIKYSAHSAHHAATSTADRRGVSISIIRRTAGWSGNSLAFRMFYNRPDGTNNDYDDSSDDIIDQNDQE